MHSLVWLVLTLLAQRGSARGSLFRDGDIVPTSRRAQFHGSRTTWHDVIGQYCPRFGMDRLVYIPLPRPIGYDTADEYKIMLSFDHDRQLSTWLPVISKRVKFFPMVELVLTRTGPYLVKVSAKVTPVPKHYLEEQPQLAQEFKNPNFWPKPLLVYYRWESHKQVNESLGLYVLLVSGLGMMVLLALSVVSTFGDKLEQFINDVGREDDVHNGAPPGAGPPAQSMAVPYPPASPSMGFAAAAASSPFFPPPMVPPPRGPKAD